MNEYSKLYLGGQWVTPASDKVVEVRSPANLSVVGHCPEASEADVDAAVAVARKAFESNPWQDTPMAERAKVLSRVSQLVIERGDAIAQLISDELGQPVGTVQMIQNTATLAVLDYYAGLAESFPWEETRFGMFGQTVVRREPVGVVAAIYAWNASFWMAANKAAPALLAGCPVILKPPLETPLDSFVLAELFAEAGLPEGMLSVLPAGPAVSEYLVTHPGVDKVSFTGSTPIGRRIGVLTAEHFKRVSLELGGKSAAILLEDVDINAAMPMLQMSSLMNSGQACIAQTRILTPRSRYAEITEALVSAVGAMRVGDPSDPMTEIGPLVSQRQRERVEGYIAKGNAEGARLATGGKRPSGLDVGWYVEPTVFLDVDNAMTIAQEEIFGPVLSVIPYDTEADAIRIANDSPYGLAGSVWTPDVDHGMEIARKIRTGSFGINWYAFDMGSPFGGYKNSGIGREDGPEGLEACCETKSIIMPMG